MVQIQNSDAITAVRDGAKLSISEGFPTNLLPNVQAVLDMTPEFHRRMQYVITRTSNGAIATTEVGKDTYLTGALIAMAKAAADTGSNSVISCYIDGVLTYIHAVPGITLTAHTECAFVSFSPPIKVDRGTAITLTLNGNFSSIRGIVYGYTVDSPAT